MLWITSLPGQKKTNQHSPPLPTIGGNCQVLLEKVYTRSLGQLAIYLVLLWWNVKFKEWQLQRDKL